MIFRSALTLIFIPILVWLGWLYTQNTQYPPADKLFADVLKAEQNSCYIADAQLTLSSKNHTNKCAAKVYRLKHSSKIEYLTKPKGAVIITNCQGAFSYDPLNNTSTHSECCGLMNCSELMQLLLSNYKAQIIGEASIAKRACWVLSIKSRHFKNYPSRVIWVDKQNHLILRAQDIGCDGKMRSDFCIQNIEMQEDLPESIFNETQAYRVNCLRMEKCANINEAGRIIGLSVTEPGYIPKGYRLEGIRICRCSCGCNFVTTQIRYTDGLQIISIFQHRNGHQCKECRIPTHNTRKEGDCSINLLGNNLLAVCKRGDRQILVMGNLPKNEIRKIALSFK